VGLDLSTSHALACLQFCLILERTQASYQRVRRGQSRVFLVVRNGRSDGKTLIGLLLFFDLHLTTFCSAIILLSCKRVTQIRIKP
jgi:hypothetical protein